MNCPPQIEQRSMSQPNSCNLPSFTPQSAVRRSRRALSDTYSFYTASLSKLLYSCRYFLLLSLSKYFSAFLPKFLIHSPSAFRLAFQNADFRIYEIEHNSILLSITRTHNPPGSLYYFSLIPTWTGQKQSVRNLSKPPVHRPAFNAS